MLFELTLSVPPLSVVTVNVVLFGYVSVPLVALNVIVAFFALIVNVYVAVFVA